jgi:hypothetical protein
MTEKIALSDVLSTTNSMITLLNYSIQQANNKKFRDSLCECRDNLEAVQWDLYLISKEKGYYVPAAPGGAADVEQVKNSISK